MVSITALLTLTLAAAAQIVSASPTIPRLCKEIHPRVEKNLEPRAPGFYRTKLANPTTLVQWKSSDDTSVELKHYFQTNSDGIIVSTKDRKYARIEVGFQVNGDQFFKRWFKVKKNARCYIDPMEGHLKSVTYVKRINQS
ncbi:hypothetical protein CBS101457_005496 [Exobasidium rhododendri]|nr:hypothetical protein CBS101457_005496 [Exobasidium rhododendri]